MAVSALVFVLWPLLLLPFAVRLAAMLRRGPLLRAAEQPYSPALMEALVGAGSNHHSHLEHGDHSKTNNVRAGAPPARQPARRPSLVHFALAPGEPGCSGEAAATRTPAAPANHGQTQTAPDGPSVPPRQVTARPPSAGSRVEIDVDGALASLAAPAAREHSNESDARLRSSSFAPNLTTTAAAAQAVLRRRDSAGSVPSVVAKNLSYWLPDGKQLLHSISCCIPGGQVTAILGASGAGKTTFLNLLARRQDVGSVAGDIYYGGVSEREVSQQWLGERTAYLRQFGMATISQLTAWENLCYAAALRIGSDWEYALHRIADVTRLLGLSSFMNTPVGTELDSSGLSGGQRRKLAVAIELLKDPDVLFLDELTSGLDAKTALGVILQLGHLAHAGKTIVLSIHQPRLEIWAALDNVLFMAVPGRLVCSGPPDQCVQFFSDQFRQESLELAGAAMSANPADMIVDSLADLETSDVLRAAYATSDLSAQVDALIAASIAHPTAGRHAVGLREQQQRPSLLQLAAGASGGRPASGREPPRDVSNVSRRPSLWLEFQAQLERFARTRPWSATLAIPIIFAVTAILVGTVHLQADVAIDEASAVFVLLAASVIFSDMSHGPRLVREIMPLIRDEADAQAVRPWLFIAMYFVVFEIIFTVGATVLVTGAYFLTVLPELLSAEKFANLLTVVTVHAVAWLAMSLAIPVLMSDFGRQFTRSRNTSTAMLAIGSFFGGFIITRPALPPYYRWLMYANPMYNGLVAANLAVLDGTEYPDCASSSNELCTSEATLDYLGLQNQNLDLGLGLVAMFLVFFLAAAAGVLQLKVKRRLARFHSLQRHVADADADGYISSRASRASPACGRDGAIVNGGRRSSGVARVDDTDDTAVAKATVLDMQGFAAAAAAAGELTASDGVSLDAYSHLESPTALSPARPSMDGPLLRRRSSQAASILGLMGDPLEAYSLTTASSRWQCAILQVLDEVQAARRQQPAPAPEQVLASARWSMVYLWVASVLVDTVLLTQRRARMLALLTPTRAQPTEVPWRSPSPEHSKDGSAT